MMHPQAVAANSAVLKLPHDLPLKHTGVADAPDALTCQTCHNPHATPSVKYLLRTQPGATADAICLSCHPEPRQIEKSMHSREFLDPDNKTTRACNPCHATHALQGSSHNLLWAARTEPRGVSTSERLCLGCHSEAGGAKPPAMFRHPATTMQKLAVASTQPTELQQKLAMIGDITCSTCHSHHGREIDLPETRQSTTQPIARTLLSAIKPMLKPDIDRDFCTTCHGLDATRVYLYFHHPAKRAAMRKYIE
jgi:predicted CXXCH cytochrome family protein